MSIGRRQFLLFLGTSLGVGASNSILKTPLLSPGIAANKVTNWHFTPLKLPLPLSIDKLSSSEQIQAYKEYKVEDDLILPDGYTYDVIAKWGDRVGDSRFGYNNDYISFLETGKDTGYLTVNFEYISGRTWAETYEAVIGKQLPFEAVKPHLDRDGTIKAYTLPDGDTLKGQIKEISREGLIDQGVGIIAIKRNLQGVWERTYSGVDRRITGISGLEDGKYLNSTGPAVAVFTKTNKKGYDDSLGSKIIGTFQNCAGGTTPWGTVLTAEENFQDQVSDPVLSDGSSLHPDTTPFVMDKKDINGRGNVFGLAPNKYGWMVEIDPGNPEDYGTKHTWLGRFRHEAVTFFIQENQPMAVYSGCDRRGGHIYKFVSENSVKNRNDKNNSRLFTKGMLYGAKFNADKTGSWIALNPDTPVNPVLPSQIAGIGVVALPKSDRSADDGKLLLLGEDGDVMTYKSAYRTLGDIYEGNTVQKQGAILIDAHYAANAAGVTCTGRPEDAEIGPDNRIYITFTSGTADEEGGADKNIFRGPSGETPYEFGWIIAIEEDDLNPASMTFKWEIVATGGEPLDGGMGFANPDNLAFDGDGNLWMVNDISTANLNKALPSRTEDDKPVGQKDTLGVFGNNAAWVLPRGEKKAYPFAIGPMDTELTGLWFTADQKTLFMSVQHPGEVGGTRKDMGSESRRFSIYTTAGEEFSQVRFVPIGSNWPGKEANQPPRPAVVAIRHLS